MKTTITALRSFSHGLKPIALGDEFEVSPVDAKYYVEYGFAREGSKDAVAATAGRQTEESRRFGAALYSRKDMQAEELATTAVVPAPVAPATTTQDAAPAVAQPQPRKRDEKAQEADDAAKKTQEVKPVSTQSAAALVPPEARVHEGRADPAPLHSQAKD